LSSHPFLELPFAFELIACPYFKFIHTLNEIHGNTLDNQNKLTFLEIKHDRSAASPGPGGVLLQADKDTEGTQKHSEAAKVLRFHPGGGFRRIRLLEQKHEGIQKHQLHHPQEGAVFRVPYDLQKQRGCDGDARLYRHCVLQLCEYEECPNLQDCGHSRQRGGKLQRLPHSWKEGEEGDNNQAHHPHDAMITSLLPLPLLSLLLIMCKGILMDLKGIDVVM